MKTVSQLVLKGSVLLSALFVLPAFSDDKTQNADVLATSEYHVPRASANIHIDGIIDNAEWDNGNWRNIDQHILGLVPEKNDFSGRFKLSWDSDYLYLLAEITDDVLFDQHPNPLVKYWDDDCLEIFVDEDNSGGEHQFSFNAFAYHIGLDNQAVDIGELSDNKPEFLLLNEHIESQWQRSNVAPYNIIWEVAIKLYPSSFKIGSVENTPVELHHGKEIGFMLAYCDNDGSTEREHFMGSTAIKAIAGDKNLGYKTADVFETIRLVN